MSTARNERDRFVAFAFAAADLLIELGADGLVATALGAVQSVCGIDQNQIQGREMLSLFVPPDQPLVRRLIANAIETGRSDPALVTIAHSTGKPVKALLGACRLPHLADSTFVTLSVLPQIVDQLGEDSVRDPTSGLLPREAVMAAALRAAEGPSSMPRHLTLLHLDGLIDLARDLPAERARVLMEEIGATLRSRSAGGDAAGQVGPESFAIVSSKSGPAEVESLRRNIGDAATMAGARPDQLQARISAVDLGNSQLGDRDAARAIAYAVKTFADSKGEGFTLSSLTEGLAAAVESTVNRLSVLRGIIDEERFSLAFQPIVGLLDRTVHHFEALSRFPDTQNPFEMITFGEAVGLIEDFDIAVCHKTIAELDRVIGTSCAINISGRSVQNEAFRTRLQGILNTRKDLKHRLLFELTESSMVDRVDEAAEFLRWIRTAGFGVALDDFGAGGAAYSYLRHFDVDYVKMDGPFLKDALTRERDRAMIRSVTKLCAGLKCQVIGEMIETDAEAKAAADLGIGLGQGWLFGKPVAKLPSQPAPPLVRRRGVKESWGR